MRRFKIISFLFDIWVKVRMYFLCIQMNFICLISAFDKISEYDYDSQWNKLQGNLTKWIKSSLLKRINKTATLQLIHIRLIDRYSHINSISIIWWIIDDDIWMMKHVNTELCLNCVLWLYHEWCSLIRIHVECVSFIYKLSFQQFSCTSCIRRSNTIGIYIYIVLSL